MQVIFNKVWRNGIDKDDIQQTYAMLLVLYILSVVMKLSRSRSKEPYQSQLWQENHLKTDDPNVFLHVFVLEWDLSQLCDRDIECPGGPIYWSPYLRLASQIYPVSVLIQISNSELCIIELNYVRWWSVDTLLMLLLHLDLVLNSSSLHVKYPC